MFFENNGRRYSFCIERDRLSMTHNSIPVTPTVRKNGAPHDATSQNGATTPTDSQNAHNDAASGYPDVPQMAMRGELSPADREILERESSISPEAIEARGYFTSNDKAQLQAIGFPSRQALVPSLVIPLHNWRGESVGVTLRPQIPRIDRQEKPIKYETPKGAETVLDVAPLTRHLITDTSKPIIFTEGAKKADSAASRGLCAVNLAGVWNFLSKGIPHSDLNEIALKNRACYIAYDSDLLQKPGVEKAARRLAVTLQNRGAIVKIIELPDGPTGEKTGLDDFFARGGTVEELFSLARDLEPIEAQRARRIDAPLDLPDTGAAQFPTLKAEQIPTPKLTGKHGAPEYDARQIVEILRPSWEVTAMTTHAAHAARIGAHIGDGLMFCPQLGWLYWNGAHWEIDDRNDTAATARAATLSRVVRAESATLYRHAATLASAGRSGDAKALSEAASELLSHAKQIEGSAFIAGALKQAAGTFRAKSTVFDLKPWRIGFQNGTWDCGQWREHKRDDYLLHLSPVRIDFQADRSEWLAVLDRITGSDADFARTLQDLAAYVFSGASHLRFLPWLYGPKGTGKSTFAELLQTVLDGMAVAIDPGKLYGNAARERLGADLWNKRAAICSEVGSSKLEAQLLKTLAGGDSLPVRFLFREQFTASPCHVLIMVANDAPRMDAYDDALRDRVKALPFTHPLGNGEPLKLTGGARIEAVRRNPKSPLVCGFAAWALEGLVRLYETQEIFIAPCVDKTTAQFWADTDPLTDFWETIEKDDLLRGVGKTELRGKYETWCKDEGQRPLNRNQWTRACEAHGLINTSNGSLRFWVLAARPKSKELTQLTQLDMFSNSYNISCETKSEEYKNSLSCVSCVSSFNKPTESEDV
jgi:P4 family phage/plasmid primase-like protien